jgi:hypothetical protein
VRSSTIYYILLVKFGELIELYTLDLIMGYQQWLGHLPPSWLVLNKQPHYPNTWSNKDTTLGTNQQPCERHRGVYLIVKPMKTQPHQKQHMLISRRLFFLKGGTLSISLGSNWITSTSRIFLNMNVHCT